nr:restriction endonuclease subunit S [uncultured Bifidobacterium sp.]
MPAWEQRKLGELADSFEYGLNVPASDFDGIHKYLRITDIDDETHRFNESDLTSPLTDLMKCEQYRLAEGDLLFARTGASVGKTYLYQSSDGLAYYAGFLIRAHIHDDASADFVFQSTLTERYRRFVSITSQRSGQPGINAKEYSEYEVPTPSLSEQRLIGRLFSRLDALITLHQRKHNNTDIEHATGEMRESTQMMSTPVSGSVYEPTDSDIDPYLAFYLSPTLGATHQLLNGDVTPHILVGILAEFHGNVCAVQLTGMNDLRHRPFVAHDIPPPSGTIRIPTPE